MPRLEPNFLVIHEILIAIHQIILGDSVAALTNKQKTLGLWTLTALVAGNMIGSGAFLLPASLANYGSISILGWMFTAAGGLCLALMFSKLSSMLPKIGGPYAYCHEGFGDFIGFLVAYNYWIALWVGNAAIAIAFVGYLGVFWPLLVQNVMVKCLASILTVWLLTLINIKGVRQAGQVQLVTMILKLIPLILIGVFGLFFIHPEYLHAFNVSGTSNLSAFTGAASVTLWTFIGLESATIPTDNIDNPQKLIPRATILGTLIATVVYLLGCTAIMGLIPNAKLVLSTSPYAEAASQLFGPWGNWLVAAGAAIACFGTLNGWILLQGQVPLAAARDGLFPKAFAKESKAGTPVFGLVVSSILVTILLCLSTSEGLVKQYTMIILLASLATLMPYLFTCMAELLIFLRQPATQKVPLRSIIISILSCIYVFWAIIGTGQETIFYGTLLLLSSVPVYTWMQWHHKRMEQA
jgi:APA family basic amino acid/polyamine antiporter